MATNVYSERFLEVVDNLNTTDYRIWNDSNGRITKSQLSHARNGRAGVTLQMIDALCDMFQKVNPSYIITGRGAMFSEEGGETEHVEVITPEVRMLERLLQDKDRQIEQMQMEIDRLKEQLEETKTKIAV